MKKLLTLLMLLILVMGAFVAYSVVRDHAIPITVTHPHPQTYISTWTPTCKTQWVEGGQSGGNGYTAAVVIMNTGTKIQAFSNFRVYFWQGGIILSSLSYPAAAWNYLPGPYYAAVDEDYSFASIPDQFDLSQTGPVTCSVTAIS